MVLFNPPVNASFDWAAYGRFPSGTRYVEHSLIDKSNVARLKQVWEFHTGDMSDGVKRPSSAFECTPLMVDQTLFVVSPFNRVFALDPDSGKAKWTYDPKIEKERPKALEPFACRGLASWRDPSSGRYTIYLATYDARLIALDAKSGHVVSGFGDRGQIQLRRGVGGDSYLDHYIETSAPTVVGNRVVVGSSIGDNFAVKMPSGVVRAFDARNGQLDWSWEPLNHPESAGAGNAWGTLSADPDRDMLFVPTGSASPDFCGVTRPGDNADANSIVALRASTGKKLWSFQVVHHDLWDYDVPAQPLLAEVSGKLAVVAMTKMGHVFVLDRMSGKPILPTEERRVPQSSTQGEESSATQPFPILPKPLVPDRLIPWAITAQNKKLVAQKLDGVRQEGVFTPPSIDGTLIFPGDLGGCNWSGGSYSPSSNTLFVNTNSLATIVYLIPQDHLDQERKKFPGHEIGDEAGSSFGVRREWLYVPDQIPANKPPWGMLHAIDLTTGKLRWQRPLGVLPQYKDLDIAKDWGSPNLGGSFVTDTGLVFIAATLDQKLRAFDSSSGSVLWETELPAGGQATPMSYRSSRTGRQYVVQCAGGHRGLGAPVGDSVVAFCLR